MKRALAFVLVWVVGFAIGLGGSVLLGREPAAEGTKGAQRFEAVLGVMPVPVGNSITDAKVELGRLLFFDPRLSGSNGISCATCHNPDKGFSDGLPRGQGAQGELGRNSPTVWNAAYVDFPFWDGRASSLEQQAAGPITADAEMAQDVAELVRELEAVPEYRRRFTEVFGPDSINFTNVLRAIAAFERTLLTYDSPFDRFQAGDRDALSADARRGMDLFFGKAQCSACHTAPLFTDNRFHVLGVPAAGPGGDDLGRFAVTGDPRDKRAFRTPTLRNIALSGPYMHNGVFETLEQVVDFYNAGGREVANKSPLMKELNLTQAEVRDLVAFLESLTDTTSTSVERPELPD